MKKTSKIISLLLTLAMMVSMVVPMTVSASFNDVASDHHYYEAINNLSAEGILNGFEDGSFKPGDPVTRAQFTKIICYALSVGNLTYSDAEKSIFTDVAPEHWAANNIVTAYKQSIINGMGDGTFAPEAGVNYEQAVKMVVCALGYSPQRAESLGGYPGGYMSIANTAKILEGITDAKMGQTMNRGAVAQLIDNMLDADQIIDGEMGGSIREEISVSKKFEGKLIAGYQTSLRTIDENRCLKGQILIKGATEKVFDISDIKNFDIDKYLGRSVTVYYEEESGVSIDIVSSISLQAKKNKEVKIDLDLICDYDASSIEYYTDANLTNTETVSYAADADKILNGAPTSDSLDTIIRANVGKSGYILLVSSNSNSEADVVFVNAYKTMIVSHVDKTNKKVYGKNIYTGNGSDYGLDVDDRNKKITITSNGKSYSISSIRENQILSIAESAKAVEVLLGTGSKSGTITDVDMSSNPTQITIDGKTYTVVGDVYGDASYINAGRNVTVYFDAFGKVARVEVAPEAAYNYGYLSYLEYETSIDSKINVMIYKPATGNSTLTGLEYRFADKVTVDGTPYTVEDDVLTIVGIIAAGADVEGINSDVLGTVTNDDYSQPIRYSLNKNGLINAIVTNQASTVTEDAKKLSLVKYVTGDGIECTLNGANFGTYRISSSTPVIYIPVDRTGTYQSKPSSFFKDNSKYYVQFANSSSTGLVSCVYLYGINGGSVDTATITEDTKPMIVTGISGIIAENSTKKIELKDITSGSTITCYDNSIAGASTLTAGDVVRVAISEKFSETLNKDAKFIDELEVLADAETVADGTYSTYIKTQDSFRTLIGTVKAKEKDNSGFMLVKGYNGESVDGEESYGVTSSTPIYMISVDVSSGFNEVSTSNMSEIGSYTQAGLNSRVMIYTYEGLLKAIIIFK